MPKVCAVRAPKTNGANMEFPRYTYSPPDLFHFEQ